MPKSVRDRISKELYDDLVSRRVTVRAAAKQLGVTENYLSHAIPERAPKPNPQLLRITRRMYQDQIATEAVNGRHTVEQASKLCHVSMRTMFRRMKAIKDAKVL